MTTPHLRYFTINQSAIPAGINFLIGGVLTWLVFHNAMVIPLWDANFVQSMGGDILGVSFFLPFLVCLGESPRVRRQLALGKVPGMCRSDLGPWHKAIPTSTLRCSIAAGLAGVIALGLPTVFVLSVFGIVKMSLAGFVLFKALYAAALAAAAFPVIALSALLNDASGRGA